LVWTLRAVRAADCEADRLGGQGPGLAQPQFQKATLFRTTLSSFSAFGSFGCFYAADIERKNLGIAWFKYIWSLAQQQLIQSGIPQQHRSLISSLCDSANSAILHWPDHQFHAFLNIADLKTETTHPERQKKTKQPNCVTSEGEQTSEKKRRMDELLHWWL